MATCLILQSQLVPYELAPSPAALFNIITMTTVTMATAHLITDI